MYEMHEKIIDQILTAAIFLLHHSQGGKHKGSTAVF